MTAEEIQNQHNFENGKKSANRIMVIGVGGGGNNAVNHMFNEGIRNVTFVVANTDLQALNNSPVPTKLLFGNGLGAGNKPEVAREAAENSAEEIERLFDNDTDMVFITAGMGGGTGTGASPVVARIARERKILTVGIITIPFLFEGERKIIKALNGAEELSKYVDALLVINNDRLAEIYSDFDFINAFAKADDTLLTAAQSISEIITVKGYMNLDFNDVDTTLRNGGTAIISTGYGEGPNRVTAAIQDALHSPLLKNTDVFSSKRLLFNIYFSPKAENKFKMDETKELTSFVSNIDNDVDVIWGATFDESLGDRVKITILAAGFNLSVNNSHKLPDSATSDTAFVTAHNTQDSQQQKHILFTEADGAGAENPDKKLTDQQRIEEEYGKGKVHNMRTAADSMRYIVLRPDQLDDDSVIQTLDNTPAFGRDKGLIANIKTAGNNDTADEAGTLASENRVRQQEPDVKNQDSGTFINFTE